MERVRIDEIKRIEDGMPMAILKVGDQVVGYLTPFRLRKFQVSRNTEGEGDLGSSMELGLIDYVHCMGRSIQTANESLKGQALIALVNFCSRNDYGFRFNQVVHDQVFFNGEKANIGWTMLDIYAEECRRYLMNY